MTGKRTKYSGDFKAKVALEAIKGEMTLAQLAAKHGVHQTLINSWKRQAIENMASAFSGKAEQAQADRESEVEKLHAKIGQLLVERDFLRKASGRLVPGGGER
ncbi:transposase [Asticcacaulis sp. AC466]|nr:transposase [Asticcacaulis sp. AC466]